MSILLRIAGYGVHDLMRSRWLLAYAGFFAAATLALLRFSDSETKALVSLASVVLFVVPLANLVFGTMYLYAAREFVELLLAQPIRRAQLFGGLYLGLAAPVALAGTAGIAVALLLAGASAQALASGLVMALLAGALSFVFTALATVVAYGVEDRVRGLVTAIGAWLLLALVYDAVVLMAAVRFSEYPLERPLLVAMLANPIDLARLLLLQQLDGGALLGYTGAVFRRAFTGAGGVLLAAGALLLWIALPALAGARFFHRKDF